MNKEEVETLYDRSRPRKLLALDGGGIRGALTLEVLVKIESMLAKATGRGTVFASVTFSTTSGERVQAASLQQL